MTSIVTRPWTVKEARLERGMSREQLGADAGLSPRTIYAIEMEGVCPQRATRRVLATALGCDPEDLIDDFTPAANGREGKPGVGAPNGKV